MSTDGGVTLEERLTAVTHLLLATSAALVQAIREDPEDLQLRHVLADVRAALRMLQSEPPSRALEARLRSLLGSIDDGLFLRH